MMPFAALLLLPLAQDPSVAAEVDLSRWQEVRARLPQDQHAGLDYLLEHMPQSDREQLDPELLLENISYAYRAWREAPWHEQVSEQLFFDAILPYASINERRDRWRKDFHDRFQPLVAEAKTPAQAAAILNNQVFPLVGVIYSTKRPKADQSPYESIEAGMASCTGLSVLLIDACRAVGVPARFVGTPLWADGSGNHSWVEVWDDGWHFTGAAEPTGDRLDEAWFTGRAAQAIADDRERAIYAVSYRRTPLTLPMVWKPEADTVYAVNVTHRYASAEEIPAGNGKLRVVAKDASGQRLPVHVVLREPGGEILARGDTRDERFDANDHLTLILPLDREFEVEGHVLTGEGYKKLQAPLHFQEHASLLTLHFHEPGDVQLQTPQELLWQAHEQRIRATRQAELDARVIEIDGMRMRFSYATFGEAPESGHALYISMHGGGGAPKEVNDQQWENQKRLYEPAEGIYLAPRAPTDTWNLWHQAHVDRFFDRILEDFIVLKGVDPDRIYLMGYSAGGDGVYQLAPRMADRFAAAAMMAGHPNETQADGLRNLPFTLHMGAEDAAYDRNKVAASWKQRLAELRAADPQGYLHHVELHEGKGHWMDRQDAVAVPWMAQHTRPHRPQRIVWLQDDVTHRRYYWLAVDHAQPSSKVVVSRHGNRFTIEQADGVESLKIRLDASMVDFGEDVVVLQGERELHRARVQPQLQVMRQTLQERGDPRGIYSAEIQVDLARVEASDRE